MLLSNSVATYSCLRKGGHFVKLRHFPLAYVLAALNALAEIGESFDATKMTPKERANSLKKACDCVTLRFDGSASITIILCTGAGRANLQARS